MKHPLIPDCPLLSLGPTPSRAALPRQFRLTVWNQHKCKHADWERDFSVLAAQSDLFLIQEARLYPYAERAMRQSGLHWQAAVSFLSPRGRYPTGICAGCCAPAGDIVCNASVCEPLLRIPKMLMSLTYPLAQTRLLVIHLHAINFTGITPFKHMLANTAQLLENFEGPVILAGDFNVWNAKRREELRRLAQTYQLEEVLFSPDERTRYFRHAVDYIFTRGLETVDAQVPPVYSSDHRPLSAILKLT